MKLKSALITKYICLLFLLSYSMFSLSQSQNFENSLLEKYKAYFKTDRKSVHLHINKNTFIAGEQIWFSTYVFNQTKNLPSKEDEYIYIDLINENAEIIASKTVFFKNGFGNGDIVLDESLENGRYFLQAYTANMQNYEEDESTVYPIEVKNLALQNSTKRELQTYRDSLQIEIAVEGENLIEDLFSNLVVRTTNRFGFGLKPDSLFLIHENMEKISKVEMDQNGLGMFSLVPKRNERYYILSYLDGNKFKEELPSHQLYGYNISVIRNHSKKQFIVTIHSREVVEDGLNLVIHKDGNAITLTFSETNEERQSITISYDVLQPGTNTISLLNKKGWKLSERIIFHRPILNSIKMELKKFNSLKDTIEVALQKSDILENSMVSASILPGDSKANIYKKKPFYSVHLESYFNWEEWRNLSGLTCETIEELYYLDKVTLFSNSKYQWYNLLNEKLNIPDERENMVTLEGYIDGFNNESESQQVLLFSKENELLLSSPVDSEKKFKFKSIALAKGSKINLTLSDKKGKPIKANFFYTIKPSLTNFRYRYQPKKVISNEETITETNEVISSFRKIEQLNEVTVTASKLKYQKFFKSYYGVKVDSTIGLTTLKDFLSRQGYYSMYIKGDFPDYRRAGSSQIGKLNKRCGYVFPSIMIDGKFDTYIDNYIDIRMELIDEIYFDRANMCSGFVVVFTNEKYKNPPVSESEKTSKEFVISAGHDIPNVFKRPDYFNTTDDGFTKFGVLSWNPVISSQQQNEFTLTTPTENQNSLRVVMEGMTATGDLISQDFLVQLRE